MSDIIVIGAGVVGASIAFRLAEAGARVTVLEAARIGGGTSGATFSWINSNDKAPRAYHDLNVAGMAAHAALADEFGGAPWLHRSGRVEWADGDALDELARRVARLAGWGYEAAWLTEAELAEREPDLAPVAYEGARIAWFPAEGWIEAVPYAAAMLRQARRRGARIEAGVRVADLAVAGGRATGVVTRDRRTIPADLVVNAGGFILNDAVRDPALHLPMAPTNGLLIYTPPVPVALGGIVTGAGCDFRPDGGGRILLQGDAAEEALGDDLAVAPVEGLVAAMVDRLRRVLPAIGDARAEAVRVTRRAIPADGLTALGFLPGLAGYYAAVTHSGATLAAYLGKAVADDIMSPGSRPELEPFRARRLFP